METRSPETIAARPTPQTPRLGVSCFTAALWILAMLQGVLFVAVGELEHRVIGVLVAVGTTLFALAPVGRPHRLAALAAFAAVGLANVAAHLTTASESGARAWAGRGSSRWALTSHDRGSAARLILRDAPALDHVRVEIDRADVPTPWHVQLSYSGARVRPGVRYLVAFRARADRPREISCGVSQADAPWAGLGWYRDLDVGTRWRDYVEVFTSTGADDHARLIFDLGASVSAVEIAAIELRLFRTGANAIADARAAASGRHPSRHREFLELLTSVGSPARP